MAGQDKEYKVTVDYMLTPGANSSHRVIGVNEGQHAQIVADDNVAFHAEENNQRYLSIEFAQPLPDDPYSDWQYRIGAAVVREWAKKYGFPRDRVAIVGHDETAQGQKWGKSDPGKMFDWQKFMRLVKP